MVALNRYTGAALHGTDYNALVDLVSGTTTLVAPASATGLLQLGGGGFAGGGGGNFAGSSAGTVLAINAPTGYLGALADLQVGGTRALLLTGSQLTVPVSTSLQSTLGVSGTAQFNAAVTMLSSLRLSVPGNSTVLDWGPTQSEVQLVAGTSGAYLVNNVGFSLVNPNAVAANGEDATMWDVRLSGLLNIYCDGTGGTTATYGASAVDGAGNAVNFSSAATQLIAIRMGRDPVTDTPTGSGKFYLGVDNITELNNDLSRPVNGGRTLTYSFLHIQNSRNWGVTSGFGPAGDNNPAVWGISQRGEQVNRLTNSLGFPTAGLAWVSRWKEGNSIDTPASFFVLYNTGMIQLGKPGVSIAPPAASATYQGGLMVVYGGAGVADTLQICLKAAGGTYSWKTIVTG